MNYIVISPYYPQNFQQFTIELANKGITVLGIGQEPYEQLDEPLRNSLTEYFRVENLESMDQSIALSLIMNTGWNWMRRFGSNSMSSGLSQKI